MGGSSLLSVDAFKPENWSQELRAAYEKALVFVSLCNRNYGTLAEAENIVDRALASEHRR